MSSGPNLRDPRRAARIPAHCPVVVRHRFFTRWRADSEDLGPNGCRLLTPRVMDEGTQVRLFIRIPKLGRTVDGIATVVWVSESETDRSRLGLRFQPGKWERRWFDALLAVDPRLALAAQRRPSALPWRAELYLGTPRRRVTEFSREELAVLRRVKPAVTVLELVASLGKASDRLVGALFSLVEHRQLVLDPAESQGPEGWRHLLGLAESFDTSEWLLPERSAPTDEVQRLLAAGREHLAAGRVALAAELFRQARALAPDEKDARAEVRNMGRYG